MNKKILNIATASLILAGLFNGLSLNSNYIVSADAGKCNDAPGSANTTNNFASLTAPSGKVVNSICIKSGSNMFGDGHSDRLTTNTTYENGCYEVTGIGSQTVTVKKVGSGNNCQDLSHVDVYFNVPQPSPTFTPINSPTVTPTLTPTPNTSSTPTPTQSVNEDKEEARGGSILGATTLPSTENGKAKIMFAFLLSAISAISFAVIWKK